MKKSSVKYFQKGAVLVEFAIITPLFLLLLLGIIEFSWAYYHFNILNKSVQDGARYFSDYTVARYDGTGYSLNYPINTKTSNIGTMQNLITFGNMAGTGSQLLPGIAPSANVYCYEEDKPNKVCLDTTKHIRVTATYNHNLIFGDTLNNISRLVGGNTNNVLIGSPVLLTASTVLRVE